MTTFRRIHRDDIHAHIRAGTSIHLVEALPEKYYRDGHLPGAILLPHDEVRARAGDVLPAKNDFIVVYCANTACHGLHQRRRVRGRQAGLDRGRTAD